jgi:hypothetical protein
VFEFVVLFCCIQQYIQQFVDRIQQTSSGFCVLGTRLGTGNKETKDKVLLPNVISGR